MPRETSIERPTRAISRFRERALADLAEQQHGVVARSQAIALGLGKAAIGHRLEVGRLHSVFAGVYAVGHRAIGLEGEWMAAVLASGERAVLSHRSAAALWGLRIEAPVEHEVTIPRSTGPIPGLRRHRSILRPDESTFRRGIAVTCLARTLFDLAACVPVWEFERALREAEFLRLPMTPTLEEILHRRRGRRGARVVRVTLEGLSRLSQGTSRSSLEDRFLRFIRRARLPAPETNVSLRFGGVAYEADCVWRQLRLIVELDGHAAHGTRSAFESDRERDRRMQAEGWRVVRVTWRQLNRPEPLARDLRRFLFPETSILPT
jgi:very-short-patch-repair endonuclease/predicted transcriptional regulator of viral defense system